MDYDLKSIRERESRRTRPRAGGADGLEATYTISALLVEVARLEQEVRALQQRYCYGGAADGARAVHPLP